MLASIPSPLRSGALLALALSLQLLATAPLTAQITPPDTTEIYHVNRWLSLSIGLVGNFTNIIGLRALKRKDPTPTATLRQLENSTVNRFDRWALRQDPAQRDRAQAISDVGLNLSLALPLFLFVDREIRRDWLDIGLMYAETHAIGANIYAWSPLGPAFQLRYRPIVYYPEVPDAERANGGFRNSFFSGHVSSTATGAFFAAKLYCDYHPGLGAKKWWWYGGATLPTAMVALYRIKALKHFPSDVIVGAIVGTGMGLLIPELHRRWQNRLLLSAVYTSDTRALALRWRF
ncbi:MAG: phosphatase PAP2 family protein [Bacteroidota bacterium]